jgi:sugar phosphate isomerase/epimerase
MITPILLALAVTAAIPEPAAASPARPLFAMDTSTQRPYPRGTMPVDQQFDLLKELGYAGVSWTADDPARVKEARDKATARGISLVSIYCPVTLTKEGARPDPRLKEIIGVLRGSGCIIWLHITSKDFAKSSPEGDETALPGLREIAGWAEDAGLKVAIYPHLNDWTERVQDAVRVAKKVDRKNFGVGFNLCHCLKVGDEARIPELLAEAAPHLFIVTVNGADAGAAGAGWDRLIQTLDRGTYDLKPLLKRLDEVGFRGPIAAQGYGIPGDVRENLTRSMEAWKRIVASP